MRDSNVTVWYPSPLGVVAIAVPETPVAVFAEDVDGFMTNLCTISIVSWNWLTLWFTKESRSPCAGQYLIMKHFQHPGGT